MPSRSLVLCAVVSLLSLAAPRLAAADAMKPEARAHLDEGLAAYRDKDWPRAIREFRAGYALDARAEFLFAWAQAERLSGHCADAIDIYEQFLATGPAPEQADAARQMSERCRTTLAQEAPPAPVPPAEPEAAEPEAVVEPESAPPPVAEMVWWKDGWGATLTGVGVVGLGVGIGLYVAAGSSESAAERAASYDAYARLKDEAASRRTFAAVSLGAGAALLVTGGVRYFLVHKRERATNAASAALSFSPGGATVWVSGSF